VCVCVSIILSINIIIIIISIIKYYIARPTYCFNLMYTCGLTVVIKRIGLCYVMLHVLKIIS